MPPDRPHATDGTMITPMLPVAPVVAERHLVCDIAMGSFRSRPGRGGRG